MRLYVNEKDALFHIIAVIPYKHQVLNTPTHAALIAAPTATLEQFSSTLAQYDVPTLPTFAQISCFGQESISNSHQPWHNIKTSTTTEGFYCLGRHVVSWDTITETANPG
jgi:hypothetical protein